MFFYCIVLVSIKMNNFITSSVSSMDSLFSNCKKLTSIDISYFDLSSVNKFKSNFFNLLFFKRNTYQFQ